MILVFKKIRATVNYLVIISLCYLVISLYFLPVEKSLASVINEDLLRIHAALYPKIILMDFDFEQKLVNNHIDIVILYGEENYTYAKKLQNIMREKYKKGIKGFSLRVRIVSYTQNLKKKVESTAFYLFPTTPHIIQETVEHLSSSNLIFVYDPKDLKNGCHIGLKIGRKARPVINLDAVKSKFITLRPILLKISDFQWSF